MDCAKTYLKKRKGVSGRSASIFDVNNDKQDEVDRDMDDKCNENCDYFRCHIVAPGQIIAKIYRILL